MAPQEVHRSGTDDGWHGVIEPGGQFEPDHARYHMYIGMSNLKHINKGLTRYEACFVRLLIAQIWFDT
jgi:hypothetical protein